MHEISFHICKAEGRSLGSELSAHRDRDPPPTWRTPVRACRQFFVVLVVILAQTTKDSSSRATVKVVADIFIIFTCSGSFALSPSPNPLFLSQACLLIALNGAGQSGKRDRSQGNAI